MTGPRFVIVLALAVVGVLSLPGSSAAAVPSPPDPTCSPGPADCKQWHSAAVVTVHWAPPPGGIIPEGCEPETITADTAGFLVSCTWWSADLTEFTTHGVKVKRDATPPSADARPKRGPDSNGWYNHGLTVEFSGGDALSGLAGCSADRVYSGPDSGVVTITGGCTDGAGNTRSASFGFQYDATPPNVVAKPDRQPNKKGWYNRRVKVEFIGTDATSGVGSCADDVTYGGPDVRKAAISGTCTDKAANTSSAAAYELSYDAKPPGLERLRAKPRKTEIALSWQASKDADAFTLTRRPGLKGSRSSTLYTGGEHRFVDKKVVKGVKYLYTLTASDEAGNETVNGLRARTGAGSRTTTSHSVATPALQRPVEGARVAAPPLLDWTAVRGATYYNVQLFRNGKKVLTAWPGSTSFHLARSWRFDGRAERLTPGRYRWYVWPGFGSRAAGDFGKLVGTRTFVVTR